MAGLLAVQVGTEALKKLLHRQSWSVPAIKISELTGDSSKRPTNGANLWSIPVSPASNVTPASLVRKMFKPWNETAQSVSGRLIEIALSQPSPKKTSCQLLLPVQCSVPS